MIRADAAGIATVHVLAWQAAYRGLIPQEILDGLDVDRRRAGWERVLDDGGRIVVATSGDEVVGFANVCPTRDDDGDPGHVGEITAIYLLPDRWGTGVGRDLMAAAVDALAGFREATLWVLDTNERARRFYAAAGWAPDGAVKTEDFQGVALREVRYRAEIARD